MWPVFHIGTFAINAYHAFLIIAFVTSTAALLFWNNREPQPLRLGPMLLPVLMVGALMGARLMFLLVEKPATPWYDCVRIWKGGYYYHGGAIGGIIAYMAYLRVLGNPILIGLDRAAPFFALGESITRVGCFCSGCCWGRPSQHIFAVRYDSESPAFYDQFARGLLPADAAYTLPAHPAPLYLSISMLGLFAFLMLAARHKQRLPGDIMLYFFCLHGIIRYAADFFRGDLESVVFGQTITQCICLLVLSFSLSALCVRRYVFHKCQRMESRQERSSEPASSAAPTF